MTYKYRYIRRELYESNPAKKLKSFRSLSGMSRLIRWPMWAIAVGILCCIGCSTWLLITAPQSPLMLLPFAAVILLSLTGSLSREKRFYHLPAREKELAEQQRDYAEYLAGIRAILLKHGIDGPEKLQKLRAECEALLKAREEKYARFHRSLINMLIGVPVGALITGLIYRDSGVVLEATVSVLLIGALIFALVKMYGRIGYYTDEYFKDQNLLDAINEVEYADGLSGKPAGPRPYEEEAQPAGEACAT